MTNDGNTKMDNKDLVIVAGSFKAKESKKELLCNNFGLLSHTICF